MKFEWDENKNVENIAKHGLSFDEAKFAFCDKQRLIERDINHSTKTESRYFLYGDNGKGIVTIRFTVREDRIRIYGAGYWREGKRKYEQR